MAGSREWLNLTCVSCKLQCNAKEVDLVQHSRPADQRANERRKNGHLEFCYNVTDFCNHAKNCYFVFSTNWLKQNCTFSEQNALEYPLKVFFSADFIFNHAPWLTSNCRVVFFSFLQPCFAPLNFLNHSLWVLLKINCQIVLITFDFFTAFMEFFCEQNIGHQRWLEFKIFWRNSVG